MSFPEKLVKAVSSLNSRNFLSCCIGSRYLFQVLATMDKALVKDIEYESSLTILQQSFHVFAPPASVVVGSWKLILTMVFLLRNLVIRGKFNPETGLSVPQAAIWMVFITIFMDTLAATISTPALPYYARSFHVNNAAVGYLYASWCRQTLVNLLFAKVMALCS